MCSLAACHHDNKPVPAETETSSAPQFKKEGELQFLDPDGKQIVAIDIEIADDDARREQGLMYRPSMEDRNGMLFLFDEEEPQSFWMKNTIIPLDIIYVNAQKEIVHIAQNTQPYSEKAIPSGAPAQYVIEVNAGFSAEYGVHEGDRVEWTRIAG